MYISVTTKNHGEFMKASMFILITFMSFSAFAIKNSNLEQRHQKAVKEAIVEKCSFRMGTYEELKTIATPIRVDQGILDYNYTTVLKAVDRVDSGVRDNYLVTVESHYGDTYDHDARDWGVYWVSSVNCELVD